MNYISNCNLNSLKSERGSVLLITAFLLVGIVAFAALAFELTVTSASIEQANHNAKLASLAALDAYMNNDGDESAKRIAALNRANEVAQLNLAVASYSKSAKEIAPVGANSVDTPE